MARSLILALCSLCVIQNVFAGTGGFGGGLAELGGGFGEMGGGMGEIGGGLGEMGGGFGEMGGGFGEMGGGGEGGKSPLSGIMGMLGNDKMCRQISDCPCGSFCVSNENITCTLGSSDEEDCTCQKGCVLFDKFLGPKNPEEVYGRSCECGDYIPFVRGRVIWCKKGDWVDQPVDKPITQWNPNCIFTLL